MPNFKQHNETDDEFEDISLNLPPDATIQEIINDHVYSLLSKFGFMDGEWVRDCPERVRDYATQLIEALGTINDVWQPILIATGHSPYYVGFKNLKTGEIETYWDIDKKTKQAIEERLDTGNFTSVRSSSTGIRKIFSSGRIVTEKRIKSSDDKRIAS